MAKTKQRDAINKARGIWGAVAPHVLQLADEFRPGTKAQVLRAQSSVLRTTGQYAPTVSKEIRKWKVR